MKPVFSKMRLAVFVFAILVAAGIAVLSFHEGRRYQAKAEVVKDANDECFDCWMGLMALNSTNHLTRVSMADGIDSEMDLTAWMLAVMARNDPSFVGPSQYQLLRRFRDYRKTYGRHYQYQKGVQVDPVIVDKQVAEAMTYLATIHNTNEWLSYHGEYSDLVREIEAQEKK